MLDPAIRRTIALGGACGALLLALESEPAVLRKTTQVLLSLLCLTSLIAALRKLEEIRFRKLKYVFAASATIVAFDMVSALEGLIGIGRQSAAADLPQALTTLFAAPLVFVSLWRLRSQPQSNLPWGEPAELGLVGALVTIYGGVVGWLAFESFQIRPGLGSALICTIVLLFFVSLGLFVFLKPWGETYQDVVVPSFRSTFGL